ncbi:unnamed protein product [Clonostachys rosea]|uniref:Uncharacterized protein n=1 Tax=Bionectria ochroleuca TaxID=29856 RepID=A0ABY6U1E9_BIOOC|nr:unnamed protein product [Clonostachys rosea]
MFRKGNLHLIADKDLQAIPLLKLQDVFYESTHDRPGGSHIEAFLFFDPDRTGGRNFHREAPGFFTLPQLRKYECLMGDADDLAVEPFCDVSPRSSSVEEIILHASHASHADGILLQVMLSRCKVLKKFEFIHGSLGGYEGVMPRDILEAILPHANTLEDLYINLQDDPKKLCGSGLCPERFFMGTELRQMDALKKLTLGMQALTGTLTCRRSEPDESEWSWLPLSFIEAPRIIDCLPENLEYLKIHGCTKDILEQARELISVAGQRFKKLRYFGILFYDWMTPAVVLYDLGRGDHRQGEGDRVRNVTSRKYSEDLRQIYLELRGLSDVYTHPLYKYIDDPGSFEE